MLAIALRIACPENRLPWEIACPENRLALGNRLRS
jgi:hypothetical protein